MYELLFWRYLDEIYLNNQEVYEALVEKEEVEGLAVLPVEVIVNRINSVFSEWERVDENSWKNPKGKNQITSQHQPEGLCPEYGLSPTNKIFSAGMFPDVCFARVKIS